jgi:amino acid adenylation domain-containing protein
MDSPRGFTPSQDSGSSLVAQRLAMLSQEKRALLERLLKEKGTAAPPSEPILRRRGGTAFPLSYAQERMWFLDQLAPGNPFYNLPSAIPSRFPVDIGILERSLNELVRRHEALRTTFQIVDGQPQQIVHPPSALPLPVVDLSDLPIPERESEARKLATLEAQDPFDLAKGPLIRFKFLHMGDGEHILLLTLHHIVSDGWSMNNVFFRDLGAIYEALTRGSSPSLPRLPIQYGDYAAWQREWLTGDVLQSQLDYWEERLRDLPVLDLPTDRPRPSVQTFRGAVHDFTIPKTLVRGLRRLSQQEGATPFMVLLAAFSTLLHRYSRQDDIVVGTPVAGRNRRELENLVGLFVNSLVLRCDLSSGPTFRHLLKRVREAALGGYAHQDVPFEKLVQELQPERDLSRNPLFQVMVQLQHAQPRPRTTGGMVQAPAIEAVRGSAPLDIALNLLERDGEIYGRFEYSTELFEAATITRMGRHLENLLQAALEDPDRRLNALPMLGGAERELMLGGWNATRTETPDTCIHQLVEAQAARTPAATALSFEGQQLTYDELNRRANMVAHHLLRSGIGPESLVAIYVERSLEMIVGLLGILKAGAAYVPLDPAYPRERIAFMLDDAQVAAVLTTKSLRRRLPSYPAPIICLDSEWATIARAPQHDPSAGVTPDNLAYVIYTSGSTGKPKGVLIEHRGLCAVVAAQLEIFRIRPTSRVLQFSSLSFDASVSEIFVALTSGATLCLARQEDMTPGPPLARLLRELRITFATLPPSALAPLPAEDLPELETMTVAGEACPQELVERWAPGRRFLNLYGPTEATICATWSACSAGQGKPTIGRPIPNVQVYLLDEEQQLVPIGVPGELYIGGAGVARGYLNRPELTAAKFIPNPLPGEPPGRLYRTGDLGRCLPGGDIEFLGRIDRQVKLRGFRIEVEEIERTLRGHRSVREAVVEAKDDSRGGRQLVAYVTPAGRSRTSPASLRRFLQVRLPPYMVPAAIMTLDALPVTPNQKIDRVALPPPSRDRAGTDMAYVPPKTRLERLIASTWQDVLQTDQVGLEDNFFDLGGHSLLMAQVHTRLQAALEREISLVNLFRYPTVSSLASCLLDGTPNPVTEHRRHHPAEPRGQPDRPPAVRTTTRPGHDTVLADRRRDWLRANRGG